MRGIRFVSLLLVFVVCGCGRSISKLMVPPEPYTTAGIEAFSGDDANYSVFYVTDRNPVESDDPSKTFGNKRGEALHVGRASVRIGAAGMSWDEVKRQSLEGKQLDLDITRVEDFGKLAGTYWEPAIARRDTAHTDEFQQPGKQFYAAINEALAKTKSKRIVLYTTGFNTNFRWPIQMAAQFRHFSRRNAVWISNCWAASDSMFKYVQDAGTAGLTVRRIRTLILGLAAHTDVERIDLVAYSFGAGIVSGVLTELRLMHYNDNAEQLRKLKIGNVYYVAPDEDLDMFRNMFLDRVEDLYERLYLYLSESDSALNMSRNWYFSYARLGRSLNSLTADDRRALADNEKAAFIDVAYAQSRAGKGKSGHGYWYGNPWVSGDIVLAMCYGLDPAARGLVRSEDGAIWQFPEDYLERLARVTKKLVTKKLSGTVD